jgi:amino acid adenylation domain-containing protein
MRILLTMNLPWVPATGGANKCNRGFAEGLARRGHTVEAVVPALAVPARWTREEMLTYLETQGVQVERGSDFDLFRMDGVEIRSVADPSRLRAVLTERLRAGSPDWVVISSEDPSQNLLDAALKARVAPVVYIAHTPTHLPFGPQAFYPSERRTRMLRQLAGCMVMSRFVADYLRRYGDLDSEVLRFPIYGAGPFPDFGQQAQENPDDRFVTLVNPCAIKGISVFLGLARALPKVRFAAVPTWGTTPADRKALAVLPNVTLLEPTEDIDRIFARTRVLLMPSLWQEAFGVTSIEAMLRGVPVLASHVGGLPEATLGIGTPLPVRPIEAFADRHDANEIPQADVPEQDLGPWIEALTGLLDDPGAYARRSAESRAAALRFVEGIDMADFERYLDRLPRRIPGPEAEPVPAGLPPAGEAPGVAELTPEQRALLMLRLRKKAAQKSAEEGTSAVPPIPRASRDGEILLSFAQQRLWFLDQVQPGNPVYNLPTTVTLGGEMDVPAFEEALRELARRHEAVRTTFPSVEGRPRQEILPAAEIPAVFWTPVVDLDAVPEPARTAEVERLADEHARHSFDLTRGPLLLTALIRTAEDRHWVLINLHHIVADGWSIRILIQELMGLYLAFRDRRPHGFPELPLQYADFAVWQRGWLQGAELDRQLGYWRERLGGEPPVLELPADRPRPAMQSFRGDRRPLLVEGEIWSDTRTFSHRHGLTPFMTTLAAFKAVLARLTGQEDISVGTPIAGRNRQELEGLIGFFVNTLVLRTDLSGDPAFRELAGRVREVTLGAYASQDLPFDEIVRVLGAGRDMSRHPLFQVMFALHSFQEGGAATAGDLDLGVVQAFSGTAKFDFDMMLTERPAGLRGEVEYSTDLFDPPTVDRVVRQWRTVLEAALANPDRRLSALPLLAEEERHQLLAEWNDSAVDFPADATLHGLFEAQAASQPEAPAVLAGPLRLTYAELADRSARLARHLRALGVAVGDRVAICLDSSPARIVGLMGIARAGAAYVPLDPAYPAARLDLMLRDAQVRAVVTQPSLSERFADSASPAVFLDAASGSSDEERGEDAALPPVPPESPTYVIYTSGSTGAPKGVVVDHRGRVNNFLDFNRRFGVGPDDRLLAVSSLSFDMTAYDVFGTLASGGAVVLPTSVDTVDPAHWAERIHEHGATVWHSAPALLELLVGHLEGLRESRPLPLRLVLLGGDWIPLALPDRLRRLAPGARVISMGGATEVSMDSTIYEVGEVEAGWKSIPYGVPMWNQRAHVVDVHGNPAPIGVPGELLLGGVGVGQGYFSRPDLTASKFVPDRFGEPGGRLYRTGDLARFRAAGWLELLGRIDFQVKVRGVRIELGEIVAALERHEAVREAVVVARRDGQLGAPRLAAYVVPQDGARIDLAELAAFLRARLPDAMVPSSWMALDQLPLSPNGKVDRRALPDPEPGTGLGAHAGGTEHVEPRTALERVVAGVWGDFVPAGQSIGALDNFFALGGHSLLATQVVSRLRALLPVELSLRALLEAPTVAGLAAALDTLGRAEGIDMDEVAETVLLLNEMSEDDVQRMLAERAAVEANAG